MEMTESQEVAEREGMLVLGVDTCGPSGSVALVRTVGGAVELLGQTELAGRTYSATLVSAVDGLLTEHGVNLSAIGAIVVVHGPGSFTGVRMGLSAVKGLAEPGRIPVVAASRLAVLAAKARTDAAALDAHRHEVFLRLGGEIAREMLAGAEELSQVSKSRPFDRLSAGSGAPSVVAVCEDAAAGLIKSSWGGVELVCVEAPTAGDAIEVCLSRILSRDFDDVAVLDGHYLRRSDAEIFCDPVKRA
jgi:tRNA threonylcarbamoyladenosine biosynthesis protein TsaB